MTYSPVVIVGEPKVGEVLVCVDSGIPPEEKQEVSYQWERDGQPIPLALNSSYTTQEDDLMTAVTVAYTHKTSSGFFRTIRPTPLFIGDAWYTWMEAQWPYFLDRPLDPLNIDKDGIKWWRERFNEGLTEDQIVFHIRKEGINLGTYPPSH